MELIANRYATGGLAYSSHHSSITSKMPDVFLHPVKSNLLICEAKVATACIAVLLQSSGDSIASQKSADADSVIEVDAYDGKTDLDASRHKVDRVEDWKIGTSI